MVFRRSKSFLAQAYESEACSGSDAACVFDPLSTSDLRELAVFFPILHFFYSR